MIDLAYYVGIGNLALRYAWSRLVPTAYRKCPNSAVISI